ncbi:transcriptional repressor LexA [Acidithiobacillus ferrianus]|uniref:transcriptional repressor LexA n=1 Tax=Acidithiobacillus ferrianus TaxID=2678518 RepID=UPI0034E3DF98
MDELTPRQAEILAWIRARMAEDGLPPTRAEMMRAFAFHSPNAAESHLRVLARKGYISLRSGTARGIHLCNREEEESGLPLVGRVAAGQPMLAEEFREGRLPVDPGLFSPRADYLLRVRGMSMRDAGILDGDILAVRREAACVPQEGQMVVARVNGEVTVKRWRREGDQVWLLPEHPDFSPIPVDLRRDNLIIEGVVVGLLRVGGKL